MYDKTYDGSAGYLVKNPIDRFLMNSTTPGLVRDDDGGLAITMQRQQPTETKARANWLPTPEGPYYLTFRMYWPDRAALDGSWRLPGVERVG